VESGAEWAPILSATSSFHYQFHFQGFSTDLCRSITAF
jgi:hypothetical protein